MLELGESASVSPPVSAQDLQEILDTAGSTLTPWVLRRNWCLLVEGTWSWEPAPAIAVPSCQGLV